MIKNRTASLTVIFFVYMLATFCGLFTYNYLTGFYSFSYQIALLIADVFATILVFIFSLIFKNASVYDPYWSLQPPVILTIAFYKVFVYEKALAAGSSAYELPPVFNWIFMACLLLTAVYLWAIRLTANWCYNFKSFEYQDWRYVMLKEKSGKLYPLVNFFGIHMFPTLVVYLCVLPAVTVIHERAVFQPVCFFFILLSEFAAVIQCIADIQMHRFRASGQGGFIRTGLWKHARHPNYLGEILMWWGIGLASIFALGGHYWLLAGAAVNTLMFLFISIPMADKRQSRKPGFEEYKKSTRML